MSLSPVYTIHSFSEIVDGVDAFHHRETLRQENGVLRPGEYRCHDMTLVEEQRGRDDYGIGCEAVQILNDSLQPRVSGDGGSIAVVLTAMDYLLYALLRNETCKGLSEKHATCLDRLQAVLDRMRDFGPVSCSQLVCHAFGSTACGMHNRKADLDICIDGKINHAPDNTWEGVEEEGRLVNVVRFSKQKFLHELADSLLFTAVAKDLERIIYARVPVFHYTDIATGVHCDVIVGAESFRFKSTVMGVLGHIDYRYFSLVRLVKIWADYHGLVDAPQGMLNSYSLKLLVLFHLQTRPVPVLPRLDEVSVNSSSMGRPIRNQGDQSVSGFRETMKMYIRDLVSYGIDFAKDRARGVRQRNRETLSELFVTFLRFVKHLTAVQEELLEQKYPHFNIDAIYNDTGLESDPTTEVPCVLRTNCLMQNLRVDCWDAAFKYEYVKDTDRAYHLYVRDPFEVKADNAARSLSLAGERKLHSVASSFCEAFDDAVSSGKVDSEQVANIFRESFGSEMYEKSNTTWEATIHQTMSLHEILQPLVPRASLDCLLGVTDSEIRQLQAMNVMNFENA